jgi:hypothetical protein
LVAVLPYSSVSLSTMLPRQAAKLAKPANSTMARVFKTRCTARGKRTRNTSTRVWLRCAMA